MEVMQNGGQPVRKAELDSLKRDLERVYQNVKATRGERREQAPAISAGMVIRGK